MSTLVLSDALKRAYLPEEFKLTVWSKLKPYYNDLQNRKLSNGADLERWLLDWNELSALVSEEINWRYIRFSINTEDESAHETYIYAVQRIIPKISVVEQVLSNKLLDSTLVTELDEEKYRIYLRKLRNNRAIYREENLELRTKNSVLSKDFGRISSQMTIELNGEEITLPRALNHLESSDRALREEVYRKVALRAAEDSDTLHTLFEDLLKIRHQMALNAGFDNFRDYKFQAMGRFDYLPEDCAQFHQSIREEILPVIDEYYQARKQSLKLDRLYPWDLHVDMNNGKALAPFADTEALIQKTKAGLTELNPFFGQCLDLMQKMGHLDLDSRKGKQPGGYNMPLPLTGVPFIFMNATGVLKDGIVLSHESGHAVHAFLTKHYTINTFKQPPSEIAELAAMTMELLVMENWETFFDSKEELRRAKVQQFDRILRGLPWIALVDQFQHWLYTHPEHSRKEREEKWLELFYQYQPQSLSYEGITPLIQHSWQRQLHIFEVPFYYIEYGMAQLGALAIWRKYREQPAQTIQQFTDALKLGYTRSVPEIYEAAGISFDFSQDYVHSLATFLRDELMLALKA